MNNEALKEVMVFHNAFGDTMKIVATVKVFEGEDVMTSLERAFELTNNVECSWSEYGCVSHLIDPSHEVKEAGGCRSTSVGDICLVNHTGDYYLCEDFGWKKMTEQEILVEIKKDPSSPWYKK